MASQKTIQQILDVLSRHVSSQEAVRDLILDLYQNVQGNKSVMDTLEALKRVVCSEE